MGTIIYTHRGSNQLASLLHPNPRVRGWSNYYRACSAKRALAEWIISFIGNYVSGLNGKTLGKTMLGANNAIGIAAALAWNFQRGKPACACMLTRTSNGMLRYKEPKVPTTGTGLTG